MLQNGKFWIGDIHQVIHPLVWLTIKSTLEKGAMSSNALVGTVAWHNIWWNGLNIRTHLVLSIQLCRRGKIWGKALATSKQLFVEVFVGIRWKILLKLPSEKPSHTKKETRFCQDSATISGAWMRLGDFRFELIWDIVNRSRASTRGSLQNGLSQIALYNTLAILSL